MYKYFKHTRFFLAPRPSLPSCRRLPCPLHCYAALLARSWSVRLTLLLFSDSSYRLR